VRHLVGTTKPASWPASPEITADELKQYEAKHGTLKAGDIVIFYTGHTDKFFKPMPEGSACLETPLAGKSEGWPAPGPDAIRYLAEKKVRCVGTDGPTLGGVEPRRALMTYWAMGSADIVGIEFLAGVGEIPKDKEAYFLFAAVKIRDCHGGPGRAIALY
jgi:kynurenine formamidase